MSLKVRLFLYKKTPLFLLLPSIIILLLLSIYPLVYTIRLGFSDWQLGTSADTSNFVGFDNFIWLFKSAQFWDSLVVTLKILVFSIGIEFILGMLLALLFDSKLKGINKTIPIILLPIMLTPTVVGLIWRLLFNENFGILNYYLSRIGLKPIAWLSSTTIAPFSIVIVDVWQWTPFLFLIFYAGIKALPIDIYEAADVDGAGNMRKYFSITLPLLKPAIAIALIIRVTDFLRIFDHVYMLTFGGPGNSTETLGLFAYKLAFINASLGKASAASYILLIMGIIFGMVLLKFMKQEALY